MILKLWISNIGSLANTEEEVINVNHYTNLQPMLKSEHIEKTKQDAHNRAKLKRHVEG
jgi:hypothetical protein